MGQFHTVNSEHSLNAFLVNARALFEKHKYVTFPAPRIGPDRSLDQNALMHLWLTEYAAHLAKCDKREVTPGMLEGIKRTMKGGFYSYTNAAYMVHTVKCPKTGREKNDYTSSKSWKKGEMFDFLTWLQLQASYDGCVLESKGEYAKLQREQNQ